MTDTAIDPAQGRLLAALTLAIMQRAGGESLLIDADDNPRMVRMARVGNLALVEWPADPARPQEIYVYAVEGGAYFKLDMAGELFCLQWQHRAHPPDFHVHLIRDDPPAWVGRVSMALLAELQRIDPQVRDRLHAASQ